MERDDTEKFKYVIYARDSFDMVGRDAMIQAATSVVYAGFYPIKEEDVTVDDYGTVTVTMPGWLYAIATVFRERFYGNVANILREVA